MKKIKDPIIDRFCDLYLMVQGVDEEVTDDLLLATVNYIHRSYPELSDRRLENLLRSKGIAVPENSI